MRMQLNQRVLACGAYLLGIPALYIILGDRGSSDFVKRHGQAAFLLWAEYFLAFFTLRVVIDLAWRLNYLPWLDGIEKIMILAMAGYLLFRASRSWQGHLP